MRHMRGDNHEPDSMFSCVSSEQRIPKGHPLRAIRALVKRSSLTCRGSSTGSTRRSGARRFRRERLLRAQLLQIFYSIRSERLLMAQLDYNLLSR